MDKYKEAIDAIRANYPTGNYIMLREGLDLAIITLKKQIPEKPIKKLGGIQDITYVRYVIKCIGKMKCYLIIVKVADKSLI